MATTLVTSDEINYLIYRYLQESGFQHTAFTFGMEASIAKSNVNTANVPPGALVAFLQKGLQFTELEQQVDANGHEIDYQEPLSLLNTAPARAVVKRERERGGAGGGAGGGGGGGSGGGGGGSGGGRGGGGSGMDVDAEGAHARGAGAAAAAPLVDERLLVSAQDVTQLCGHTSEVFICAWCPTADLLASGSGDSTARIWSVPDAPGQAAAAGARSVVLTHKSGGSEQGTARAKDVTTLDWAPSGAQLATGSSDGRARVWTAQGQLLVTLGGGGAGGGAAHEGPIFALKWNRSSTLLLSGSVDKSAIVWDAVTGALRQRFRLHSAPMLDVDWRDDETFATCSTDKAILVCRLGDSGAYRSFQGHSNEVNCVKWAPGGRLLGSCSDDCTARLWSVEADKCVHTLQGHSKEIYTIKWSPEHNARGTPLLASASLDKTVRLWDVGTGACVQSLARHSEPVYSVAFSPDGSLLASGSRDKLLLIWSLRDGCLVKALKGSGGIYEVCWNSQGSKVAACFSDNNLVVLDMRM